MHEVAPGVFVATAEKFTTTTTVVAGADGGCLVVDPAVTAADIDALVSWLSAHGLHPVAGWSTHPHWDHVLWSRSLGTDVVRYATPRAAQVAGRELEGLCEGAQRLGHDITLIGRLSPLDGADLDGADLDGAEVPWDGPSAVVVPHDAHAPGHGALFLPETGVLVAGDMCSDIETPLLDTDAADPFGDYRHGLGALAALAGVRVIVPGHGHVGDVADFRRRVAADYAYLDAVQAGADPGDPRLADDWLRSEYDKHRALARGAHREA